MKSVLCEMLGIEFPLFAFSHCRNVVAAVSRAGGFGVLGATGFSPDSLEQELKWLDDNIGGKPYGVDVLIPENIATKGEKSVGSATLAERIPQRHRDFVRELLIKYDVEPQPHREAGGCVAFTFPAKPGVELAGLIEVRGIALPRRVLVR